MRSAMAPDTMVVAVAQNTSWKKKSLQLNSANPAAPSQPRSGVPMKGLPLAPESSP